MSSTHLEEDAEGARLEQELRAAIADLPLQSADPAGGGRAESPVPDVATPTEASSTSGGGGTPESDATTSDSSGSGSQANLLVLDVPTQALLGELFQHYHERLLRTVRIRLDPRLFGRIDEEDVLQEAFLAARQRLWAWREEPDMRFFVWLRLIVGQTMIDLHRVHIGARMRDAGREVSLGGMKSPAASSASLGIELLGALTSPSQAALRQDSHRKLVEVLDAMDDIDREVLVLRHFEELGNQEVAEILGLKPSAASNRYVRALARLRAALDALPEDERP